MKRTVSSCAGDDLSMILCVPPRHDPAHNADVLGYRISSWFELSTAAANLQLAKVCGALRIRAKSPRPVTRHAVPTDPDNRPEMGEKRANLTWPHGTMVPLPVFSEKLCRTSRCGRWSMRSTEAVRTSLSGDHMEQAHAYAAEPQ